jgi:hypothetical protein
MIIPFLIAAIVYVRRRCRASLPLLIWTPFCMMLGSVWAIFPDIPRLIGRMDLYLDLKRSPRTDIFLWHYTIDLGEQESIWYTVGVVVLLGCLVFVAWRELHLSEED